MEKWQTPYGTAGASWPVAWFPAPLAGRFSAGAFM